MVDVPLEEVDDDEEVPEPARAHRLRVAAATTSTTTTRSAGFAARPLRETLSPTRTSPLAGQDPRPMQP